MTRLITALLLLPVVVGIVWFLPPLATLVLALVASILCVVEYASLSAALQAPIPTAFVALATGAACITVALGLPLLELLLLGAVLAVGVAAVLAGAPGPQAGARAAAALFPVVYIGIPLGAVAAIRADGGRAALLLLVLTIIVSDSAQYYTGRAFGRTRLAPAISPKKTREGAVGGVVLGSAFMTAGGLYLFPATHPGVMVATARTVVLLGITGDLFESLLKRSAGVKDSSTLIPGHGGILDRIDSWLFAGPPFYVFVRYLQGP